MFCVWGAVYCCIAHHHRSEVACLLTVGVFGILTGVDVDGMVMLIICEC
jgi:hypothetical protein